MLKPPEAAEAGASWRHELRQVFEEVLTQKFEECGLCRGRCESAPHGPLQGDFTRKGLRSWTAGQATRNLERLKTVSSQATPCSGRTPTVSTPTVSTSSQVAPWIPPLDSVLPFPADAPATPSGPATEELPSDYEGSNGSMGHKVWQFPSCGQSLGGEATADAARQEADAERPGPTARADGPATVTPAESHYPPKIPEARGGGFKAWSDSKQPNTATLSAPCSVETEYLDEDTGAMAGRMTTQVMRKRFQKRALTKALPARFENASYLQVLCATVIVHPRFDYLVSFVILANAATMGVSAELIATTDLTSDPRAIVVLEKIFCALFSIELALRLIAYRCGFFYGPGWAWNIFDFCVVSFQIIEEIFSALAMGTVGWTGVLRLLRLVRVVRLARILRLIRELRVLVSSISNSMRSLVWTVLLMFLIIYSVSLCITQLVTDYRLTISDDVRSDPERAERIADLERYFGSLLRCMLSLFEAITGGLDWDGLVVPLMEEVSPVLGVVLIIFIAIAVLAILNVVTGVFVDSVLASAKADKEQYLLNNAREIFKTADEEMDWAAFQGKMNTPQMLEFFRGIDVDPSEAQGIFSLIDLNESGSINADEFLNGCVKLQGPSKALETAVLLQEVRGLRRHVASLADARHG